MTEGRAGAFDRGREAETKAPSVCTVLSPFTRHCHPYHPGYPESAPSAKSGSSRRQSGHKVNPLRTNRPVKWHAAHERAELCTSNSIGTETRMTLVMEIHNGLGRGAITKTAGTNGIGERENGESE